MRYAIVIENAGSTTLRTFRIYPGAWLQAQPLRKLSTQFARRLNFTLKECGRMALRFRPHRVVWTTSRLPPNNRWSGRAG